jgi:hypothetical protein
VLNVALRGVDIRGTIAQLIGDLGGFSWSACSADRRPRHATGRNALNARSFYCIQRAIVSH